MSVPPPERLLRELFARPVFSGKGKNPICFIDTSTLIYLERISLLDHASSVFSPVTIPQVIEEFGHRPRGVTVRRVGEGKTDTVLIERAVLCRATLFSEDKKLLRAADRQGLAYYNTLMIVLALYSRGKISRRDCEKRQSQLQNFARYSNRVWAYGEKVFASLVQQKNHKSPSVAG